METLEFRQPEIYGITTAVELDEILRAAATGLRMELDILYSNIEGDDQRDLSRRARKH